MYFDKLRVASETFLCKCCSGTSRLCSVLDLSQGGANYRAGARVDPLVGVPVYYYRCDRCGFVFTGLMDQWTPEMYSALIYNEDYGRQDPDYFSIRAEDNAKLISSRFAALRGDRLLDFGSGDGGLSRLLELNGFTSVASYDPYGLCRNIEVLQQHYRVIFAFEVFEHHSDPIRLVESLRHSLDDDGSILFSTLLVPPDVNDVGSWWYCMPRNGHISLFSRAALASIALNFGMQVASFHDGLHLMYTRVIPSWASAYAMTACSVI